MHFIISIALLLAVILFIKSHFTLVVFGIILCAIAIFILLFVDQKKYFEKLTPQQREAVNKDKSLQPQFTIVYLGTAAFFLILLIVVFLFKPEEKVLQQPQQAVIPTNNPPSATEWEDSLATKTTLSEERRNKYPAEGRALHLSIINKYPSLAKEYKQPFIFGGLTENPICLISVPSKDWASLSREKKLRLFDYAQSLIPVVKANPDKYAGLGPNAPIAPRVRANISRMNDSSWGVDVGDFTNGSKDLLSGNIITSIQ